MEKTSSCKLILCMTLLAFLSLQVFEVEGVRTNEQNCSTGSDCDNYCQGYGKRLCLNGKCACFGKIPPVPPVANEVEGARTNEQSCSTGSDCDSYCQGYGKRLCLDGKCACFGKIPPVPPV